jgi:hypothetical protein
MGGAPIASANAAASAAVAGHANAKPVAPAAKGALPQAPQHRNRLHRRVRTCGRKPARQNSGAGLCAGRRRSGRVQRSHSGKVAVPQPRWRVGPQALCGHRSKPLGKPGTVGGASQGFLGLPRLTINKQRSLSNSKRRARPNGLTMPWPVIWGGAVIFRVSQRSSVAGLASPAALPSCKPWHGGKPAEV